MKKGLIRFSLFKSVVILASFSQVVSAHEFWLEPDNFTAQLNEPVNIDIRVGQMFNGRAYPYVAKQSENFFWTSAEGVELSSAITGDKPAAGRTLTRPEYQILAYESSDFDITFKSEDQFLNYLETEGLQWVAETYRKTDRDLLGATETYYRHAKTLIGGDGAQEASWMHQPVGLRVEIVPDPGFTQCDKESFFTVLVEGEPAESLLVRRFQKDSNRVKEIRTDQDGRVHFAAGEGPYLLNTVYMEAGSDNERAQGLDWVSEWSSFTYACK